MGDKMKKALLMVTLLTGVTISQGDSFAFDTSTLKGLYIGGGIGSMTLSTKMGIDSVDGVTPDSVNKSLSNTNVSFNGVIGYEKTFGNNYVAGIEAQYVWAKNEADTLNNLQAPLATFAVKDSLRSKSSYGVSGTFGRTFGVLTPYVKLGIISTSFESKSSSPDPTKNIDGMDKKNRWGFSAGVGVRYSLNKSLDFTTEFQTFRHKTLQSKNFDTDPGDRHIIKTKSNLYNVWAGLRWKF